MTPNYNPEGKKLTFEQHAKLKREYEEKQAMEKEKAKQGKSGYCGECGTSGFTLKAKGGLIYRTCKNCGDVKTF